MTKNNKERVFGRTEMHKLEKSRAKKEHSPYIPIFLGVSLVAVVCFVLLFADVGVGVASAATYYASPGGGEDGFSPSKPFQIADFWLVAKPGDTLILLDGTYTGNRSMVNPPNGLSGTSGSPITIKALNEGKVTIDGQGKSGPIKLWSHNSWFIIEGLNACKAGGYYYAEVVGIMSNSNHNIIRRVCAWDSSNANTEIFDIYNSEYNLIEDCAGWGQARKTLLTYEANYNTIRRFFGVAQGATVYGMPNGINSPYYGTGNLIENCIMTADVLPGVTSGSRKLFGSATNLRHETHYVYGCIGYRKADQRGYFRRMVTPIGSTWRGLNEKGSKQYIIKDVVVYNEHDNLGVGWYGVFAPQLDYREGDKHCLFQDLQFESMTIIGRRAAQGSSHNNFYATYGNSKYQSARNLITIGANTGFQSSSGDFIGDYIWAYNNAQNFKGGTPANYRTDALDLTANGSNILQYGLSEAQRPKVNGQSVGAQIQYRYVNGKLTNEPLWPWPMNQRIIDAMKQSGYKPIDVTRTVFELGGGTMPDFGATGTISAPDTTPPTTIAYLPTGTDIPVGTTITVTFSEAMNKTSAENAFSISPSVSGSFSWDGEKMIFTPDSHLDYETTCTINISTEAKDLAGNNLESLYSWQFTTLTPGMALVGEWHFDEGSGGIAEDTSGNNNDGILTNMDQTDWVDGKRGKALSFDGVDSYVDCGHDASLDITDEITVMLWIKPNAVGEVGPNAGPVCKAEAGVDWSWQLRYNAPGGGNYMGFQFNGDPEGSTWVSVKQNLSAGEWYHIAGTFDGTNIKCYLNGVEKDTNQISAIKSGNSIFFIGQDGGDNIFNGTIDEVKIYTRALSIEEIREDYEAGLEDTTPPMVIKRFFVMILVALALAILIILRFRRRDHGRG